MSNLLVQNIKHTNNTSAQTIDSSGRTTAVLNNDTTYRSDSGAVTQNLVQGLCKAWCRFGDGSSTDSFNISSLTNHGTGDYEVFINNDMANTQYTASLMFGEVGGGGIIRIGNRDIATGSVGVVGTNGAMTSAQDVNRCGINVAGDLA